MTRSPALRPRLAALAGLIGTLACTAQAQTVTDGRWHGGMSAGGAVTSGNTSSQVLTLNADGAVATAKDKISLYGLTNYGRSKAGGITTKTAELFRLGGRYDYNLSDVLFAFGGAEFETNKPGGLDSRYALHGGLGYRVLRSPTVSWDLFAGLGYSGSDYTDGSTREGAELMLGEESAHKLSDSMTFKQRFVLYPGQSSVGVRSTFDAGLAWAVSGGWTLNLGAGMRYASKVPAGFKKTDTLLTMGFGYKY
jgi:putative salt-induced outer membrane protein